MKGSKIMAVIQNAQKLHATDQTQNAVPERRRAHSTQHTQHTARHMHTATAALSASVTARGIGQGERRYMMERRAQNSAHSERWSMSAPLDPLRRKTENDQGNCANNDTVSSPHSHTLSLRPLLRPCQRRRAIDAHRGLYRGD
jgi:hypothetical protein